MGERLLLIMAILFGIVVPIGGALFMLWWW